MIIISKGLRKFKGGSSFTETSEVELRKMSKGHYVALNCEPCPICKKAIPLKMKRSDYKPSISGVCQVVDVHGLRDSDLKHVRILYVDERFSVRSISVISTIADTR
jgi:hypothetical protein